MKNILTILALIALFLVSCSKEDGAYVSVEQVLTKSGSVIVKSGEENEDEQEYAEEENAEEEEAAEESEEEGEEEEGEAVEVDAEAVIAAFVETYFPETAIAEVNEDEEGYEVKLEDGTQINFDSDLEWKKISCKHSTVYTFVPESVIPEEINAYLSENYPENVVIDIKKVGFGWMVTLDGKAKIKFNTDFTIK